LGISSPLKFKQLNENFLDGKELNNGRLLI
jgi:hypothetical protein